MRRVGNTPPRLSDLSPDEQRAAVIARFQARNAEWKARKEPRIWAVAFRGATAWEAQAGRLWCRINFPRYWRTSGLGSIGWEAKDNG